MRLTESEIKAIVTSVGLFATKNPAELRLFGSRVDDCAKGGDIDLLLLAHNKTAKDYFLQQKIKILVTIKNKIGEQRIDFKIASLEELQSELFLQSIYSQSILLFKFE